MDQSTVKNRWYMPFFVCTGIFISVYLISNSNYLLFHSLAELFSMAVSMAVFIIAWNTRKHLDNTALLIIGVAYLFISGVDLLHTLAYQGMGVFKGGKTNLPTQLWISARLLQSLTFFIAPFFIHRKISIKAIFFCYAGFTALLLCSIFIWKIFPECHVEGMGLTPFKKNCEYGISFILLLSIYLFYRNRKVFDELVFRYIIASICLTIAGELAFTLYVGVYDISNFFGHYFKIISFYLIYKAIVETGLERPYDVLFRDLKSKESALIESEAKYRSMMESITDPVYISSPDFMAAYVNPAMISMLGRDVTGTPCFEAINGSSEKCDFCVFDEVKQENATIKETLRVIKGRHYHVTHSPIVHEDGSISKLSIFRDITELRQIEFECRQERDKARLYLDIVGNVIVVLNTDTTVALINKRGCELLECGEKDIIGKKWFDTFVPESDREGAKSAFLSVISSENPSLEYFENRIISRKGNERIISWHNAVLRNEAGEITGGLSSGDDITVSKKLQEELLWELGLNSTLLNLYAPLISNDITLEETTRKILEKCLMITGSDCGCILVLHPDNEDDKDFMVTETRPDQSPGPEKVDLIAVFSADDGCYRDLKEQILNAEESFYLNAPEILPPARMPFMDRFPINNMLFAPVVFNENPVGRIVLFNKKEDFGKKDIQAINRVAMFYAIAIHRLQILDSLRKAKEDLELRVEERTRDLSHLNIELLKEIEEREALEQNLLKSEKALKELSERLIQSYEEERRRIGEELHDGLAQSLSAVKVWADAAMSQMEKHRFEESMKSVDSIILMAKASLKEVRHIIKNLHPSILEDLGLSAAISWLIQEHEKMHPYIDLQKKIDLKEAQVPEILKISIFRILQEALNNISKHSRSTSLFLRFDQTDESLKMKIRDNGIGFDVDADRAAFGMEHGIGLGSMKERARLSGGVFSIVSSPGEGTVIEVAWKFPKA